MDIISEGQRVFNIEIEAMQKMRDSLTDTFRKIVEIIANCKGRVILIGIGKSGHIAKKIAATMSSLGTPAFFLHPSEAMHGDLGMLTDSDVVIVISYSGESEEITNILPNIRLIGTKIIAISGNEDSTLAKFSDIIQILPKFDEACYLNLAPSSSTTVVLAYGDALAIVTSGIYGFTKDDFALYHPAGSLGKKIILQVDDIMVQGSDNPTVYEDTLLTAAIVEMSEKMLGVVFIINKNNELVGIITDGDLRRIIQKKIDIYAARVCDVMVKTPYMVPQGTMAIKAFEEIRKRSINCVPIVDESAHIVGTVTLQMLTKAGIVL